MPSSVQRLLVSTTLHVKLNVGAGSGELNAGLSTGLASARM